jgi:predicted RNA-binding protein associated with RNAse of E/G family
MTTSTLSQGAAAVFAELDDIRTAGDRLEVAMDAGEVTRQEYDRARADHMSRLEAIMRDALAECDRRGYDSEAVRLGRADLADYEAQR